MNYWAVLKSLDVFANILTGGGDRTISERNRTGQDPVDALLFIAIDAHLWREGAPVTGGVDAMLDDAMRALTMLRAQGGPSKKMPTCTGCGKELADLRDHYGDGVFTCLPLVPVTGVAIERLIATIGKFWLVPQDEWDLVNVSGVWHDGRPAQMLFIRRSK